MSRKLAVLIIRVAWEYNDENHSLVLSHLKSVSENLQNDLNDANLSNDDGVIAEIYDVSTDYYSDIEEDDNYGGEAPDIDWGVGIINTP